METVKVIFKKAWPYQKNKMNLPVEVVETSIPFYETLMGFKVALQSSEPIKSVVL